jgi:hypothetical protein
VVRVGALKDGEGVDRVVAQPGKRPPRSAKPDLLDLMDAGIVQAKIAEVTMNRLSISVRLQHDKPTVVRVPAGTLFRAGDRTYQDLVVVKALKVPLGDDTKQVTLQIQTCCTDRRKAVPNSLNYAIQRLPEGDALRRYALQLAESEMPINEQQQEVWRFTDQLRTEGHR